MLEADAVSFIFLNKWDNLNTSERVNYPAGPMSIIKASYGFDSCVLMCIVHMLIQGFDLINLQKSIESFLFFSWGSQATKNIFIWQYSAGTLEKIFDF